MNSNKSLVPLCPKCHNYSFISFPNRTYCDVYCYCGYREQFYIKDYLTILQKFSSSQSLTCKEHQQNFTFFCDDCKEHLCSKCEESHSKSHMLLSLCLYLQLLRHTPYIFSFFLHKYPKVFFSVYLSLLPLTP